MNSEKLTPRELELLAYLAEGLSNKEISPKLNNSVSTVKAQLASIYRKFHVINRVQAVITAIQMGLIDANGINIPEENPYGESDKYEL